MAPAKHDTMPRFWRWLGLSLLIVAGDQASKAWITSTLSVHESVPLSSYFDIVLVLNSGASFSILSNASGWQRWFFTALALSISAWLVRMLWHHAGETRLPLALALILGGAIGNVIDRVRVGSVIDFLYFHLGPYGFPAFNVADSAISVGVALMIWDQLRAKTAATGQAR